MKNLFFPGLSTLVIATILIPTTSDILVNNAGLQKDSDFIVRIIFMSIKFITDKGIAVPSVTIEQMIAFVFL